LFRWELWLRPRDVGVGLDGTLEHLDDPLGVVGADDIVGDGGELGDQKGDDLAGQGTVKVDVWGTTFESVLLQLDLREALECSNPAADGTAFFQEVVDFMGMLFEPHELTIEAGKPHLACMKRGRP
jgi:hypothetical protein